jgi:hypothetical protein
MINEKICYRNEDKKTTDRIDAGIADNGSDGFAEAAVECGTGRLPV